MSEYGELLKKLDLLQKNETQMSDAQREQYKEQLSKLRRRIQTMALNFGRRYLFSGIQIAKGDRGAMEQIRSVLSENEIRDAERDALAVLFSCYDFDQYLRSLTPLALKIFYLGYGPYWARHCRKVADKDSVADLACYNDLIDMYWVPEWQEWKKKDEWAVTIMLPPTMEEIRKKYEEVSHEQRGEAFAGSEGVPGGSSGNDL